MSSAPDAPWPPVTLPGTQARRVRANDVDYRIDLWLPPSEPPPGGFPAIYVLDGGALFATFVEAVRRSSRRPDATGVLPTAVIGIAHDAPAQTGQALYAEAERRRDFTFGPPASGAGNAAPGTVGGGAAFLSFIADQLAPALEAELPLDARRRTLFGHSLAGHFVLRALAARPEAFGTWAAISPSIWWDEAALRVALAATLAGRQPAPRLFMAVGEYEAEVPPWQRGQPGYEQLVARRGQRQMVASAQALADELRGWLGDEALHFRVFPEEDHASVLMIAIQRLLRFASAA